jgi:hypothetical protein
MGSSTDTIVGERVGFCVGSYFSKQHSSKSSVGCHERMVVFSDSAWAYVNILMKVNQISSVYGLLPP